MRDERELFEQRDADVADPADGEPGFRSRRLAAVQARRRRTRYLAAGLVGLVVVLVGIDLFRGPDGLILPDAATPAAGSPDAAEPSVSPGASGQPPAQGTPAPAGSGTFGYATGAGKVLGGAGTVRKFRVAVEKGVEPGVTAFTADVERILADPRGWTGGGKHRFQRVAEKTAAEFTVFLATAGTTQKLCAAGGLHTEGFTSCRLPGQLIVNLDRWQQAVPGYGAPLPDYQAFALNHELGHQLGYGHEACPEPGKLAPVMQQQSQGLKNCTANAWPYPAAPQDTALYRGPVIP
ncbi:hypothetical protein Cme02nite_61340 [Catellatospora methionotrophica]|uniref:DUF3152 domain-containing protein n=1 Tax=Catellatospora methionotrophica TaxID=121620 RepID=A0A8J3LBC3_9ACTN|nr:DUF3152 domain-containing protein [Catellatospora methionotrophica]GIG17802.1 hypothetical protein Cme02nite_61340 [Catellatospora methionotrophica]